MKTTRTTKITTLSSKRTGHSMCRYFRDILAICHLCVCMGRCPCNQGYICMLHIHVHGYKFKSWSHLYLAKYYKPFFNMIYRPINIYHGDVITLLLVLKVCDPILDMKSRDSNCGYIHLGLPSISLSHAF